MRSALHAMPSEDFEDLPLFPVLPLRRAEQVRAAVVALFCNTEPGSPEALQELSLRQWKALLGWLDTSGLALYVLDRLGERGLLSVLPEPVRQRLQQNLLDNTNRTASLIEECCSIQEDFAEAGVSYAVLKGFSLWPHSVSSLELRSQLDLDFLVAPGDEFRAQAVLERHGYKLHAVSGRSREFKTPHTGSMSLAHLYRRSSQRTVEVHLEEKGSGLLDRSERHHLRSVSMPVLSSADLFLGQALHLYKHLSRDQMRCSHMVELYRHLLARSEDHAFWLQVEALCKPLPAKAACVGLALDFTSEQMGRPCVPIAIRGWAVNQVPTAARLWVRRYGARVTTASFPGTKLYLLLQEAMAARDVSPVRSVGAALVPRRLPPPITIPPRGEVFHQKVRRELQQGRFILIRIRFHLAEGLRYLLERRRWRRLLQVTGIVAVGSRTNTAKPLSAGPV